MVYINMLMLQRADAADLEACDPLRPLRTRHGCPIAASMTQIAPSGMTVGSTPCKDMKR
jgi:hypothetical protein